MVKPIKTAGKSQKQQIAMATTMKKKSKPGVAALKEIKKQQKSTKKCIAKSSFKNLVMEITSNILAERADTTGKRRTKNSQRNQSSTQSSTQSSAKQSTKQSTKIKKEKQIKIEIKKERKPKIKSEK